MSNSMTLSAYCTQSAHTYIDIHIDILIQRQRHRYTATYTLQYRDRHRHTDIDSPDIDRHKDTHPTMSACS